MQRIAIISITLLAFSLAGSAQIVVKVRPNHQVERVEVRPQPPSHHHVWIEGSWEARGGRYQWREGYWAEPRYGYHRFSHGHWNRHRGGWVWVPGHWER